jgi:hypothetical protein
VTKTIILDGKRISYCGKRNEEKLNTPDVYTVVKNVKKQPEKKTSVKVESENIDDSLSSDNIGIKGE